MAIQTVDRASELTTNKVLRDTYRLLSLTLLFSAFTATVSYFLQLPHGVSLICSLAAMGLLFFVLPKAAQSANGIWIVFAVTGLLGVGLGPTLNHYLATSNGTTMVATALGGTGVIFMGLSGYALVSKKDFSFMGGFLMAGFIVVLLAMIANIFMQMPALQIVLSAAIILLMSGFILFDTSRIINGGETNYIMATVSLFLSIYNIFQSLLLLLGIAGDD
ncbi:BAX inhibitor protein [Chromatiales bacterium (ex Bugula neritina AB1)]|nr:BAX inhibitor protein [Chromatiales bacterium (ex Bugula neritina AB1)]